MEETYTREDYQNDLRVIEDLRIQARSAVARDEFGGFEYLRFLRYLDGLQANAKQKYQRASAIFWGRRKKRGRVNDANGSLGIARALLAAAWKEIDEKEAQALHHLGEVIRTTYDPVQKRTRWFCKITLRERW